MKRKIILYISGMATGRKEGKEGGIMHAAMLAMLLP